MKTEFVIPLAIALLGGGLLTGVGQLFGARAQHAKAKQDADRLPAELGSLWIGGAEKAIASMQVALDRADAYISRLEAALERTHQQVSERDKRITALERDLNAMQTRMSAQQARLDGLGLRLDRLKDDDDGVGEELT